MSAANGACSGHNRIRSVAHEDDCISALHNRKRAYGCLGSAHTPQRVTLRVTPQCTKQRES